MSQELDVYVYLMVVLLSSLLTSGEEDASNTDLIEVNHRRFVSSSKFNGEKWTHSYVLSPCSTDEECFPIEYHNITIPPSLISCDISTGLCECQQCFVRRNDICAVNTNACNSYMTETQECSDNRKSQRTALLLSFFLSAAGAANFYIGQNLLGGIQLGLLLLVIFLMCAVVCVPCCLCVCCYDEDDDLDIMLDNTCFMIFIVPTLLVILMLTTVAAGWWMTDLVVFIIGGRGDGHGCALYADL